MDVMQMSSDVLVAKETTVHRNVTVRNYDVFINHRGPDVKQTFVTHLSAALKRINFVSFVDCEEIQPGDRSWETIKSAIYHSKIHIAVFTPRYAESEWCLDELCLLLQCLSKGSSVLFLPVFYNVEPSTLHLKPESCYNSAFQMRHSKPETIIRDWKQALYEASKIGGYIFPGQFRGFESGLVEKIVSKVLDVLSASALLDGPAHPVGIDEQLKHVLHLMAMDEPQSVVKKLGICGMGGVGKTTLAKSIYNRIHREFDSACFVESVSDSCQKGHGEVLTQQVLLQEVVNRRDIHIPSVARGKQLLRNHLAGKKVLIILDGVNEKEHLDVLLPSHDCRLGEGSQIVITTQDMGILTWAQVTTTHDMSCLSKTHSYELFNWHAFPHCPDHQPPSKYFKQLAEKVADACQGLPLALIVLATHLQREDVLEWKLTVEALASMTLTPPQRGLTAKLRISFDSLRSAEEKQMFLDIACFLLGEHKDKGIRIWSSEYNKAAAELNLINLKRKCLVKVDENGKLTMHDLLRDMGREIVEQNEKNILSQRSHLWREEDVDHVLRTCKGTSHVRGLSWNGQKIWETKSFAGMDELKLLVLNNVSLQGDFSKISHELRWFQLRNSPLEDLNGIVGLKRVAVLDFAGCQIRKFDCDNCMLQSLKELNISNCSNLKELPKFRTSCNSLEALIISGCENLEGIPDSISELSSSLTYLDMSGCSKLKTLPDGMSNLTGLTTLLLNKCSALERLPDAIGNLTALEKIGLDDVPLSTLPKSFGDLSNLVSLHLSNSSRLTELPSTVGNLRKLTSLNIISCPLISEIPQGVTNLTNLVQLQVSGCRLVPQLPENIGELKKLVELHVRGSERLLSLPNIQVLSNLEGLNLHQCPKLSEVQGLPNMLTTLDIGGCSSLKLLDMSWCRKLTNLPDGIESLTSLTSLLMNNCTGINKLPDAIGKLTALQKIGLDRVPLSTLPKSFCDLCNLESFRLVNSTELIELPSTIGKLKKLTSFDIISCPRISEIPQGVTNLTNLVQFSILDCDSISQLPENIWNLQNLSDFQVSDNVKVTTFLPPSIIQLKQLVKLELSNCNIGNGGFPTSGYSALSSLNSVNLANNPMSSLPRDFGALPNLKDLNLQDCSNLREVSCLPASLTSLNMDDCPKLERITCLSSLTNLTHLMLCKCIQLLELKGLECLCPLKHLDIRACRTLRELPSGLENLTSLTSLQLAGSGVSVLQDVESPWIQKLVYLESVSLSGKAVPDAFEGPRFNMMRVPEGDIAWKGLLCCFVLQDECNGIDDWVTLRMDSEEFTVCSRSAASDTHPELNICIFRASHPLVASLKAGTIIVVHGECDYGVRRPEVSEVVIKLMKRDNEMEETIQKLPLRQPTM